jgi:hypothetical protein
MLCRWKFHCLSLHSWPWPCSSGYLSQVADGLKALFIDPVFQKTYWAWYSLMITHDNTFTSFQKSKWWRSWRRIWTFGSHLQVHILWKAPEGLGCNGASVLELDALGFQELNLSFPEEHAPRDV